MPNSAENFDWSVLTRTKLCAMMWSIEATLTNIPITIHKFHRVMAAHLRTQLPIRVAKRIDATVEVGYVYQGGTYYSWYDQLDQKCIELVLVYPSADAILNITTRRFQRMCRSFADTILHELIHMRQYRRRGFETVNGYSSVSKNIELHAEQNYLGCPDEIDAFSFNIACELMGRFKNDAHKVIEYLNENHHSPRRSYNCWQMYLTAFEFNHEHAILKKVKKTVIRYLPHAAKGRPYANKKWINGNQTC